MPTVLLGLASCEEHPEIEISTVRENGNPVRVGAKMGERFQFSQPKKREPKRSIADMLAWKVPDGFEQLPPRPLRIVNLRRGNAECFLTYLTGGSALGNINRWRSEMGQPPADAAAIAKLKAGEMLGREAHHVDLAGTWSARGESKPGYRLVAKYAQFPEFAMSVKLLGPKGDVERALAGFEEFCTSLAFKGDFSKGANREPGGAAHGGGRGQLAWDVPEGWKKGAAKTSQWATRYVSFDTPGGASSWVTFLGPAAGSWADNVKRWVGQVGMPPLDAKALAALPRLSVLGQDVPLLEAYGKSAGLLAVMVSMPDATMFIKLQGSAAEAKAQQARFRAFCTSLRFEK